MSETVLNHLTRNGTLFRNPRTVITLKRKPDAPEEEWEVYGDAPSKEGGLLDGIEWRIRNNEGRGLGWDIPDGWTAVLTGDFNGVISIRDGEWFRLDRQKEEA